MPKTAVSGAYSLPAFSGDLVALIGSSKTPAERIVDEARKMSDKTEFVLILKNRKGLERRLLPSYINAMIRYKDGSMNSKTLAMEILLFAAGTMNIGNAIKAVKPDGKGFMVFADSNSTYKRLESKFGIVAKKRLKLSLEKSDSIDVSLTAIREDK